MSSMWMLSAESINDNRDAVFIRSNGYGNGWVCKMCGTGAMTFYNLKQHMQGGTHKHNFEAWSRQQKKLRKLQWCENTVSRDVANSLGLERWKWHVQSLCHEYITRDLTYVPGRECDAAIVAIWKKYLAKEKLSL